MILNKWIRNDVENPSEFIAWLKTPPLIEALVFDTETTGLHVTKDVPFVYTLAFKKGNTYHAFYVDLRHFTKEERTNFVQGIYDVTRETLLVGHNIIFDLHMSANIHKLIDHRKLMDTMLLIRLGMDAVQEKKGGPPLQLKAFAKKYIDKHATDYEKAVKTWKSNKAKEYNELFYCQFPKMKTKLKDFLNDFPNDVDDLQEPYKTAYRDWYNALPKRVRRNMKNPMVTEKDIPYNFIPASLLKIYAVYDAIYTYEIYERLLPVVKIRKNYDILMKECELLYHTLRMTRVGFHINRPYVEEAKTTLKQYIVEQRQILNTLAGQTLSPNQNKEILRLIQEKFGFTQVTSTGEEILEELLDSVRIESPNHPIIQFISIILELRTLSKWYTTYLMNFYKTMQFSERIYTSINQAGAVTGRVTSPFQQFPNKPIMRNGKEILNPRRMICVGPGELMIMYFDYSQIELRITAMYTILIGTPDLNLCRTYMPYKCKHVLTGVEFDPYNREHIQAWDERYEEHSAWLRIEDEKPWVSSDLHALTAISYLKLTGQAVPEKGSKEFKDVRNIGKRTNFACNYGASREKIRSMFHKMTKEQAYALHDSYGLTMPGIKLYHKYCYNLINHDRVGTNLYGRHYYGMSGHNYSNAAIQGTGADLLKEKEVEIGDWLIANNMKSQMQMNIHDEISFLIYDWEEAAILYVKIKEIMEDLPGTLVPIVAEVEATQTTWADKTSKIGLDEHGHFRFNH